MMLQVLVATMHQDDFSIADKMNICCDCVIANQADYETIAVRENSDYHQKMITTKTRGVGLNRNIALLASTADIVLFADDDVVYYDDMPKQVIKAFEDFPKADVIVFGLDMVKAKVIIDKRRCKNKKLHIWESMRYGACRIATRRQALINNNITFNQCFGGGCKFSAGEDTLFLKECFDKGLKVYSYDYVLGTCNKDTSTWFKGYNEKYFYDKGVLLRHLFPKTAYIMALYFGVFFKRETKIKVLKRLFLIYSGIYYGKKMTPYDE